MIIFLYSSDNSMKKLILKTALITVGITLLLAIAVFGVVSFFAPAAMMKLCDSIGLESISGDYAYQQYQLSGEIDYLARAFEVAVANDKNAVADERFNEFYGEEGSEQRAAFSEYCLRQNVGENSAGMPEKVSGYDYRAFICTQAALVKYRIAASDGDKEAVCKLAISETGKEFTPECPVVALAAESAKKGDKAFCLLLLASVRSADFNTQNNYYIKTVKLLEDSTHE